MFTKKSRYYNNKSIVSYNVTGERYRSVSLRRNVLADGVIAHEVDAGDRLDHLGQKYYRDTLRWWRICDANLTQLSPFELLAKSAVQTFELKLSWRTDKPDWLLLKEAIEGLIGVRSVIFGTAEMTEPKLTIFPLAATNQDQILDLSIDYLPMLRSAVLLQEFNQDLGESIESLGHDMSRGGQVSELSPGSVWQIVTFADNRMTEIRNAETVLLVAALGQEHEWVVQIEMNSHGDVGVDVLSMIDDFGITRLGSLVAKTNLGSIIKIPAKQ